MKITDKELKRCLWSNGFGTVVLTICLLIGLRFGIPEVVVVAIIGMAFAIIGLVLARWILKRRKRSRNGDE